MTQEAIVNCCCPFLSVQECYDTEEHCHPLCEVIEAVVPNNTVNTTCVSDYKWEQCVNFTVEVIQEGKCH